VKKTDLFCNIFKPFRKKYTYQGKQENTLFDLQQWYTADTYLNDNLILKALLEKTVIGYFSTFMPDVIGIDIDDHKGQAWAGTKPGYQLLNYYDQVIHRFHAFPSLLCQSPRGLHAYWVLTDRLPYQILQEQTAIKLKGIPIEIKPTPTTSLRIPVEKKFLHPETLYPLNQDLETIVQNCEIFHPAHLFNSDFLPGIIIHSLESKKQKARIFRHIPRIEKFENEVLPFANGSTNDVFVELCVLYRNACMTCDQAMKRFQLCFLKSPGYSGDLLNERRLRQRIENIYKKSQYKPTPVKPTQIGLFDKQIITNILSTSPFSYQRDTGIKNFLSKLFYWMDWHDEISHYPGRTAYMDYLYPYYRKNRKVGLYPLPYSVLRKCNDRYNELIPWLKEIDFLKDSGFQYSANLNKCKYYYVNKDKFIV
jgi:hypothetical protein